MSLAEINQTEAETFLANLKKARRSAEYLPTSRWQPSYKWIKHASEEYVLVDGAKRNARVKKFIIGAIGDIDLHDQSPSLKAWYKLTLVGGDHFRANTYGDLLREDFDSAVVTIEEFFDNLPPIILNEPNPRIWKSTGNDMDGITLKGSRRVSSIYSP